MRFHNHSRHTLRADKMLSVECSRRKRKHIYSPSARHMKYIKMFHNRKSRLYLKQQIREALAS